MATVPKSAKIRALRQSPRVALTFETTIPKAVEDLVLAHRQR